jgi:hypothetical protein
MPIDVEAFEQFAASILPADNAPLSVDDIARILRDVRTWFEAAHVPPDEQHLFAGTLIGPILRGQKNLTADERQAILQKFATAFGRPLPKM